MRTAGEVIFAGDEPADKPTLQTHAAPQSCLCLTSPTVSKVRKSQDVVARFAQHASMGHVWYTCNHVLRPDSIAFPPMEGMSCEHCSQS
jgi:hypothetical protein